MADATNSNTEMTNQTTDVTKSNNLYDIVNQTIEELGSSEQSNDANAVKADEAKKGEAKTEEAKAKHKSDAQTRIRELNEKAKIADEKARLAEEQLASVKSAFESEIKALRSELSAVMSRLNQGEISKQEAKEQVRDAQFDFETALENLELSQELKPYAKDIAAIASKIAMAVISPYASKMEELANYHYERHKAEMEAKRAEWQKKMLDTYKSVANDYPDMFDMGDDGIPRLKPDIEKQAVSLAQQFSVKYDDNGTIRTYNPLLASREGLNLLFSYLSKSMPMKAKQTIEAIKEEVKDAKATRLESPSLIKPQPPRKKTLQEIVEETIKELS